MKNIDMLRFYSMRIAPTINGKKGNNTDLIEISLAHRDFKAATGKDAPDNLIVTHDDFIKVLNYLKLKILTKTKLKYTIMDVNKWFGDIRTFETNLEPSAPLNATQKRIQKLKYKVDYLKDIIDKNNIRIKALNEFDNKTEEEKEVILNIMNAVRTESSLTSTAIYLKKESLIQKTEIATREFNEGNEVIQCLNQ